MNTAILVDRTNQPAISKLVDKLAKSQTSCTKGKLLIVSAYYLDESFLGELKGKLEDLYEAAEVVLVQVSESLPHHSQIGTMVATFFMQRYTSIPGPWLLFDDDTDIESANPITAMEKAHRASGLENSGRATSLAGGGRIPIGPVVLGAGVNKLKTLRSISGEDWRQRGRFAFSVCSWSQISPEDYPFRIPEVPKDAKEAETSTNTISDLQPKKEPILSKHDLRVSRSPAEAAANLAASADNEEQDLSMASTTNRVPDHIESASDNSDDSSSPSVAEKASNYEEPASDPETPVPSDFVFIDPSDYDTADAKDLLAQVRFRSNPKVHHATGAKKLVKMLIAQDAKDAKEAESSDNDN